MKLRSRHAGGGVRPGLKWLVVGLALLMLSPLALAQRMHGSGGGHWGGGGGHFSRGAGAITGGHQFNHGRAMPGVQHGFAARGGGHVGHFGHHHGHRGHFGRSVVVIGGLGFAAYPYAYYPYAASYPYVYDSAVVSAPAYNLPPPAPTWYYCQSAGAYYPYVTTCSEGWQQVPATPGQGEPAPAQ